METANQEGIVINVLNKEKADELIKLGFHCTEHRLNDNQSAYSFFASPNLMKLLSSQFERTDFFVGNSLFL